MHALHTCLDTCTERCCHETCKAHQLHDKPFARMAWRMTSRSSSASSIFLSASTSFCCCLRSTSHAFAAASLSATISASPDVTPSCNIRSITLIFVLRHNSACLSAHTKVRLFAYTCFLCTWSTEDKYLRSVSARQQTIYAVIFAVQKQCTAGCDAAWAHVH